MATFLPGLLNVYLYVCNLVVHLTSDGLQNQVKLRVQKYLLITVMMRTGETNWSPKIVWAVFCRIQRLKFKFIKYILGPMGHPLPPPLNPSLSRDAPYVTRVKSYYRLKIVLLDFYRNVSSDGPRFPIPEVTPAKTINPFAVLSCHKKNVLNDTQQVVALSFDHTSTPHTNTY